MKHGVAFRKLSRTTEHRMAMLRNMVTSLIIHEQVRTTVPKAKEAARLANKIITLGKKGTQQAKVQAGSFLREKGVTIPKLFDVLAKRYAQRPGGYTRIHQIGNRFGDNAPMALLEYVDNPNDAKMHMTAKTVASLRFRGIPEDKWNEITIWNRNKVLRYADEEKKQKFEKLVQYELEKLETNWKLSNQQTSNNSKGKILAGMKVFQKWQPDATM